MMTQRILRIGLTELVTVRIVCKQDGCAGVVELPLAEMMARRPGVDHCPVCACDFTRFFPRDQHLFMQLASAIEKLKAIRGVVLEFPIPLDA